MPELPEVELYARYFAQHALGQRIARARVLDERILGETRKEAFTRALRGRSFSRVRRHGKHFFADAGNTWLHLHFGMSGDLAYYRDPAEAPRWPRVVFDFENGAHLAFDDMRIFGVADLTRDPDDFIAAHRLGPDPLELSLPELRALVARRRGVVKALLMSQEVIAGIGNLYADETLFQCGIAPRRAADDLSPAEVRSIYTTMRKVLRTVIERKAKGEGYPPRYLIPHREAGEHCPRCGGEIVKAVVFGRTTYWCSRHQS